MADKDERLGFDPLSWMQVPDKDDLKSNQEQEPEIPGGEIETEIKVSQTKPIDKKINTEKAQVSTITADEGISKATNKLMQKSEFVNGKSTTAKQGLKQGLKQKSKTALKKQVSTKHIVAKHREDSGDSSMVARKSENQANTDSQDQEMVLIRGIIENMTAAVMMIDTDLQIVYVNPSAAKLMKSVEPIMQQTFPFFQADNLVGVCIDDFHKNPAHQRRLLSDPSNLPWNSIISVGPLKMVLNVTPVYDQNNNFIGACQEWRDVTEESNTEEKITELVTAASKGDLSQRIDASSYKGFTKSISEGINTLLEQISTPIQEFSKVIAGLESGDLTQTMEGVFSGEFAVLQSSVNSSMNNLKEMVSEIRSASSQVGTAAGEISQGNTDLSQRTEEQASSLEETASSMEELTSTVKLNAENSRKANSLAMGARTEAESGGQVIESTITAMTAINESSTKIEDIISVIDEIAFQTNLLALNAAVEAARAGEQGRGFAVVASEVRSLAQRSAAAAKEIKVLIKDSVEKVDEGTRLVDESGSTLAAIVNSVKKVSDIIAEIAAASQEQSSGINQVGQAITQLDEVTQQNAALVEQAAAASESLDEQAKGLNSHMAFFETGSQDAFAPAPVKKTVAIKKPATMAKPNTIAPVSDDDWEEF